MSPPRQRPALGARDDHAEASESGLNQSIVRAIAVLQVVADARGGIKVSDIARSVPLSYPTASRIVQTLERQRFLARASGTRKLVLGPGLSRLTERMVPHGRLLAAGRPHTEALAHQLREAVELSAVVDSQAPDLGRAIDILIRVETDYLLRAGSTARGRIPLHATSIGKILLASRTDTALSQFLDGPLEPVASGTITDRTALQHQIEEARRCGVAEAVDELEDGVSALSAGIHDRAGSLVGILNVDGPTRRLRPERRAEIAALLCGTAAAIEADLGETDGAG